MINSCAFNFIIWQTRKGYYTIKLGGKNRVMHFSMNFWANFTDLLGISLQELGDVFAGGVSIKAIRTLIYSFIS